MSELRVPTLRQEASVDYIGGVLTGSIFLPPLSSLHSGPPQPDEWINQPETFFPFLPEGAERAIILNKERVRALTIRLNPGIAIREDDEPFALPITVICGDREIRGSVVIEMSHQHTRLLDYMNMRSVFIPIWAEDALHLIRKSCITKVFETEGV